MIEYCLLGGSQDNRNLISQQRRLGQQIGVKKEKSDARLVPEPVMFTCQKPGSKNSFFATQLAHPHGLDKRKCFWVHIGTLGWSLDTGVTIIIVLFSRGTHRYREVITVIQSRGAQGSAAEALASRRTSQSCGGCLT